MTKSKENTAADRVLCFLFSFACAVAEGENGIYKDEIPTDKIRAVPIKNGIGRNSDPPGISAILSKPLDFFRGAVYNKE